MQKLLPLLGFIFLFQLQGRSQATKRVVFFTDKNGTPFTLANPSAYLSARAVDRRMRYSIPIDSTDLPVLARYVDSIIQSGTVTLLGRSKWLNAVLIQTTDATAIAKINSFPFVKSMSNIALLKASNPVSDKFATIHTTTIPTSTNRTTEIMADTFNYGSSANQIKIHKGEFLHNIGARGQGMIITFLDAGYQGYLTNQFFDSARARNQILGTWDFVQNETSVNEDNSHGMACFSTVAAYKKGVFVGSSPDAQYYLIRTEDAPTEQIIEEYNWALGAEFADSVGSDVISSSLGYTTFDDPAYNHVYADMNGNTTVISRIADLAAKKGILVIVSAGNDGADPWHYISAPADADSVLTLGAVNSSGIIASFSSFGPTSDGQVKPDVVSVGQGTVVSSTAGSVASGNGTSFSCPNFAGLATDLWQLFPELNNWKIITTIHQSSDRFASPHVQYGYGIPNMKKAVGILVAELSTINASITNCTADINWNSRDFRTMRYDIERKLPGETGYTFIKSIAAKGTVFSNQTYNTTDLISNSVSGTVSYRIQQVLDTSAAGFDQYAIDSVTLVLSASCSTTSVLDLNIAAKRIQVYPNPVQSGITIRFADPASLNNLQLSIYNAQSQLVYSKLYNKPNGSINYTIPATSLPKGNYVLVVKRNGQQYAVKSFIKE